MSSPLLSFCVLEAKCCHRWSNVISYKWGCPSPETEYFPLLRIYLVTSSHKMPHHMKMFGYENFNLYLGAIIIFNSEPLWKFIVR